jgi:uncharacterized protein
VLALLVPLAGARAELAVPALRGRVNDYAGVLSPAEAQALERKLASYEQATSHQIAVLTVPSLEGDPIDEFSIRVVDAWKLGREDADNGILVLVAPKDRQVRIEVGRGLEGAVPDVVASRIIREQMIPRFRVGDVAGGIEAGVDAVSAAAQGERLPPVPEPARGWHGGGPEPLAIVLFASIFGALWSTPFRRIRPLAAAIGGGIAAFIAFLTLGVAALWLALAFAGGALGGLFLPVSRGGFGRGLPPGGFGGGWGGGGFGGGGGFDGGGFSGGGGSFAGGGASGRW